MQGFTTARHTGIIVSTDQIVSVDLKSIVDGYAEVPRGPALGVELDEDALRRYQVK
jgi:L-alanine-DL-glutamate epimerase-like enolase superfamily enzyme